MTWYDATIPIALLAGKLAAIRRVHGIVTKSVPDHGRIRLTWFVPTS